MAQFLRPASDVDAGEFLPSTGSDLYAMLDETSPDDGDYVYATANGDFTVGLSSGTDPVSSTGHIARYRAKGNGVADLRVTLMQGGTPIASWTEPAAAATFTNYSHTLSGGEADAITDYAALRFKKEVGDFTAPTLSSPQDGTPTSDGTTGPGVSTNEANGTLYWAVLTNGGSCTDAQLKAGTGGNIVAGKAGSQAVSGTGAQVTSDITGLSSATDYELVWLHRDAAGNDSAQATVGLTTAAGGGDVAFDAVGSSTYQNDVTSVQVTITVGTLTNGAIRVPVAWMGASGLSVSSASSSVDGALTQVSGSAQTGTGDGTNYGLDDWILLDPTPGAHTITVTMSAEASALKAQAQSYSNVHQTTPAGTPTKVGWDAGNSPTSYDQVIASADGDMVVGHVLLYPGAAAMTSVSSGTERWEDAETGFWGSAVIGADKAGEASNTTITYGLASGGSDFGGATGFALKKA